MLLFKKLSDLFSFNEFDIISENRMIEASIQKKGFIVSSSLSLLQIVGDESQTFQRNKYWKKCKNSLEDVSYEGKSI